MMKYFIIFWVWSAMEFELRTSHLLGRCSYHFSYSTSPNIGSYISGVFIYLVIL
jgi:hypothetical protein